MGVVYKAEDTKLKRTVALKFLPPELTRDDEAKERFIHEAAGSRRPRSSEHLHDLRDRRDPRARSSSRWRTSKERRLKDKIERGPLKIDEVVDIAIQIAQGLQTAHEKGIVHRDIKTREHHADRLGPGEDHGLWAREAHRANEGHAGRDDAGDGARTCRRSRRRARTWITGPTSGRSGSCSTRWSTGLLPFRGEYEQGLVYQIINGSHAPLTSVRTGVPIELERIVDKCLEKKRDERYQTAADLIADLRRLQRMLGEGTYATQQSMATAAGVTSARKARWVYWAASLVIAIVAVGAIAFFLVRSRTSQPDEKPITSIAVLPFQNLSADPEQEYFSDGTTEALIAELSKIQALRVISRTSVMRFKKKSDRSLPEIARQLNVDAVVEGSIQRVHDEVRITAQLVRADPEKHIWANTYTESYRNILALESEIAQTIADAIRVKVTPEEKDRIAASRPVNPAAHEAYLKGHFYVHKWNLPDVEKGMKYLEQAIAMDSTCAPAYVDVVDAYSYFSRDMSSREVAQKMTAYARKALSIDPTLAQAYAALGDVKLTYDWDWKEAEANYLRAIALNPNDPLAHAYYGTCLSVTGRSDEGLREAIRAKDLDPLDLTTSILVVHKYIYRREYEKAEALIGEMLAMDSTFALCYADLGRIRAAQGKYDEAVSLFRKAIALGEVYSNHELASTLARSGEIGEARSILADLIRQSESGYQTQVSIAATYLALGERDSSFYWLDKAYERRDSDLPWLRLRPVFDDLRSDPRYVALVKKIGLEP